MDKYDDGRTGPGADRLPPLNTKKIPGRQAAVAIKDGTEAGGIPKITAAGWGKIAEQILALAYANGIDVRQDSALAEMLTRIEVDSPIPSEAFMAVAEILSYVYRANGQPNPFDAIFENKNPGT
jgi:flagellar biosynthesis protein